LDQFTSQIDKRLVRAKRRNYNCYGHSKSHDTVADRVEAAHYVTMTSYRA
jgi:hypothetical protein